MSIHTPLLRFALTTAIVLLSGCVSAYQPDVVQGKRISNNELAQVTLGMTKEEVQTALGTPLITDIFTNNRWEYFYLKDDISENKITQKTATLTFANNQLISITGDVDMAQVDAARANPEAQSTGGTIITKPTQKKKGIFSQ